MAQHDPQAHLSDASTIETDVASSVQKALETNGRIGAAWLDGVSRISRELTDFTGDRWRTDLETFDQICSCRNPMNLFYIQLDFTQRFLQAYLDEAAKLTKLAVESGLECTEPAGGPASGEQTARPDTKTSGAAQADAS
ncbi:Phasin protein [Limimonas halophila]|uniref:Phasin protein n=1 Tax=Limimonas halophila TaxID=1082479 RepID=A0A1G7NIP8_9PROT|nr:phasin family protein [Limimonas halophila]SDF73846.1 Phasin protein [Limimonas halophila]